MCENSYWRNCLPSSFLYVGYNIWNWNSRCKFLVIFVDSYSKATHTSMRNSIRSPRTWYWNNFKSYSSMSRFYFKNIVRMKKKCSIFILKLLIEFYLTKTLILREPCWKKNLCVHQNRIFRWNEHSNRFQCHRIKSIVFADILKLHETLEDVHLFTKNSLEILYLFALYYTRSTSDLLKTTKLSENELFRCIVFFHNIFCNIATQASGFHVIEKDLYFIFFKLSTSQQVIKVVWVNDEPVLLIFAPLDRPWNRTNLHVNERLD